MTTMTVEATRELCAKYSIKESLEKLMKEFEARKAQKNEVKQTEVKTPVDKPSKAAVVNTEVKDSVSDNGKKDSVKNETKITTIPVITESKESDAKIIKSSANEISINDHRRANTVDTSGGIIGDIIGNLNMSAEVSLPINPEIAPVVSPEQLMASQTIVNSLASTIETTPIPNETLRPLANRLYSMGINLQYSNCEVLGVKLIKCTPIINGDAIVNKSFVVDIEGKLINKLPKFIMYRNNIYGGLYTGIENIGNIVNMIMSPNVTFEGIALFSEGAQQLASIIAVETMDNETIKMVTDKMQNELAAPLAQALQKDPSARFKISSRKSNKIVLISDNTVPSVDGGPIDRIKQVIVLKNGNGRLVESHEEKDDETK